jgi:hypothetical protein
MGLVLNVVLFTVPPWRTARAQLHSDVCTPTVSLSSRWSDACLDTVLEAATLCVGAGSNLPCAPGRSDRPSTLLLHVT